MSTEEDKFTREEKKIMIKFVIIVLGAIWIVMSLFRSFYNKPQNTQTLIINRVNGSIESTSTSGMMWLPPYVKYAISAETVSGNEQADFTANAKDNIQLVFSSQFITRIDDLKTFYQRSGKTTSKEALDFTKNYIDEAFDIVVNKYDYDYVKSHIAELGNEITAAAADRIGKDWGVTIERVVISGVKAPDTVEQAIQEKIKKQQEAEASKYLVEKAQQEIQAQKLLNEVPNEQQQKKLCQAAIDKGQSSSPACYFGTGNFYGGNIPQQNP